MIISNETRLCCTDLADNAMTANMMTGGTRFMTMSAMKAGF